MRTDVRHHRHRCAPSSASGTRLAEDDESVEIRARIGVEGDLP